MNGNLQLKSKIGGNWTAALAQDNTADVVADNHTLSLTVGCAQVWTVPNVAWHRTFVIEQMLESRCEVLMT